MFASRYSFGLRRHRFRFTLRLLFASVLLIALGAAWLGALVRSAKRQERAVDALYALPPCKCVVVWYDYDFDASGQFAPAGHPAGPAWLRRLFGGDCFCTVVAVEGDFDDTDMHYIESFPYLEKLQVGNDVTDAGLEHLRSLTHLRGLSLGGAEITDAGLRHIGLLSELQELEFSCHCRNVTDAGLVHLRGLSQLRSLKLNRAQVTDAGLASLAVLHRLRSLAIWGSDVTEDGIAKLKGALPGCKIEG